MAERAVKRRLKRVRVIALTANPAETRVMKGEKEMGEYWKK